MKTFIAVVLFFFASAFAHADQLAWITKEQAEKTLEYFEDKDIEKVVLWCACCTDQTKTIVEVSNIYYQKARDPQYYEVWIEGVAGGVKIKEPVDLAYVHVKRGSKWRCLGQELKFECDPCTKPFKL